MKLSEFIALTEDQKRSTVLTQGVGIAKRHLRDHLVFLFQLHEYYVETHCCYKSKEILEYRGISKYKTASSLPGGYSNRSSVELRHRSVAAPFSSFLIKASSLPVCPFTDVFSCALLMKIRNYIFDGSERRYLLTEQPACARLKVILSLMPYSWLQ